MLRACKRFEDDIHTNLEVGLDILLLWILAMPRGHFQFRMSPNELCHVVTNCISTTAWYENQVVLEVFSSDFSWPDARPIKVRLASQV